MPARSRAAWRVPSSPGPPWQHTRAASMSKVRVRPSRPPGSAKPPSGAARSWMRVAPLGTPRGRPRPPGRGRPRTSPRSWTRTGPGRCLAIRPAAARPRAACRPVSTLTSCSGEGPPKMTATSGTVGGLLRSAAVGWTVGQWADRTTGRSGPGRQLNLSRVVVRQIVLVQHGIPRAEVARTHSTAWSRWSTSVTWAAETRSPMPRRPAGPAGWSGPRSPGRSATRPPPAPNFRFSSNWRDPSSTMPGVTTTRRPALVAPVDPWGPRPPSATRASAAPAGLEL